MKPSEKAQKLQGLVSELGTQAKAAEAMDMSTYNASHYLKLLTLPEETLKKIDAGEMPIVQKKKTVKFNPESYSRNQKILQVICRNSFINLKQAMWFMEWSESHARNVLSTLDNRGLIKSNSEFGFNIYMLTKKGYRSVGASAKNTDRNASTIHKHLVRNNIELEIGDKDESAKFISRDDCVDLGFYPAHQENYLTYSGGSALIIIDDYGMESEKLITSLIRLHNKTKMEKEMEYHQKFWVAAVECLIVYSTTEEATEEHRRFWFNVKKAAAESLCEGVSKVARKYKVPAKYIHLYTKHADKLSQIKFSSRFIQGFWEVS